MYTDTDGVAHIDPSDLDDTWYRLYRRGIQWRSCYRPCAEPAKEGEAVKEPLQVSTYRRRAQGVEAWKVGTNFHELMENAFFSWCPDARFRKRDGALVVDTIGGDMEVNVGDYIAKIEDVFYVFRADVFERRYELVSKNLEEGATSDD